MDLAVKSTSSHLIGYAVLVLLIIFVILAIIALASRRLRRPVLRMAAWTLGGLVGVYLVIRAVAEFFIVNYSDPASYRNAWGGPTLAGVFAVHAGPGLLILIGAAVYLSRRRRASTAIRQ